MAGTWIDIGGGMTGYLAVPASGSGPGMVLLQEIFGVNAHMRDVADLYAEEGYVVLAPDMFHAMEQRVELGYDGADLEKALGFYQRFDMDQAVRDIVTSVSTLRGRPECTGKVGAIGFCLGGKLAWLAAARAGVDAAVSYYGVGIETSLSELATHEMPGDAAFWRDLTRSCRRPRAPRSPTPSAARTWRSSFIPAPIMGSIVRSGRLSTKRRR